MNSFTSAKRISIAGVPFAQLEFSSAVDGFCTYASTTRSGGAVHLANAYTLSLAHCSQEYLECLQGSLANLPDGKPVSWVSRFGRSRLSQVRGPAFFEGVMDQGRASELRHFLLGATDETLTALKLALNDRYPGVNIVGMESPPFRSLTQEEIRAQDARINDLQPDVVWVGLGTPKQDFEARRLASSNDFLAVAVGAAFDFSAGVKQEAPKLLSSLGLEWAYRFACEPRRLWRRYMIGNWVFLWAVLSRSRLPRTKY